MALNAKVKKLSDDFGESVTTDGLRNQWELRFTLKRLLVMWGVMAGMLVIVFLFGLYTGKQQGIKLALDGQSEALTVRLPIVSPPPSGVVNSTLPESPPAELNSPQPPKENFDFSQSKVVEGEDSFVALEEKKELPLVSLGAGSADDSLKRTEQSTASLGQPDSQTPKVTNTAEVSQGMPPALPQKPLAAVAIEKPSTPNNEPKTPPKKTALKKGGWLVQVSASSSRAEAVAIQRRLSNSGIDSTIQEARVNGVLYFRVIAGPYSEKNIADNVRTKAVKTPGINGKPFVRPNN